MRLIDTGKEPSPSIQPTPHGIRALRTSFLVRADCKTLQQDVVCHCRNLSETGLLVRSDETLEEGTEVTLRFALLPRPIGPAVEVEGSVVRVAEGNLMAIRFVRLRSIHHTAIAHYVERDIAVKSF